ARTWGVLALTLGASVMLSGCAPLFDLLGFPVSETKPAPDLDPEPNEFDGDYAAQEPAWEGCGGGMECAEIYAPLDWENPDDNEPITLALVRQQATGGDSRGTIF